jgi:TRAP transporter TAXI family solute receptor
LQGAGLSTGDVEAAALKSTEQAAALCERRVDAAIWPAGVPNRSAAEATATCAVRLVALEMPEAAARDSAFKQATIAEDAYDGVADDVPSWGPIATLVTAADTPEAVVYTLVKAVFENLEALRARHPAFGSLAPETMIRDGLVAELHPGAVRYFAEQGWM